MSCLNITRLWQCSPVATPIGCTARATAAWPRTSSGLVGSSIHVMPKGSSRRIQAIAVSTSQAWFASTSSGRSGPIASRAIPQRRMSSSTSAPTFSLMCRNPSSSASRMRRRSLSSEYPSQPGDVVYAGMPSASSVSMRAVFPAARDSSSVERLLAAQRVRDVAEVDERDLLLGRHLRQQPPQRLALPLGVEVPHRVDDGGRRHVDHALLRPEPAQLAVA